MNTTPLPKDNIDLNKVFGVEHVKRMYDNLENKSEYKVFMDSMTFMYSDALKRGISTTRATAVLLGTYEMLLRTAIADGIMERVKKAGDGNMINLSMGYSEVLKSIERGNEALADVLKKYKDHTDNIPFAQFKYSLQYAADKWGDKRDQNAATRLINKITGPEAK